MEALAFNITNTSERDFTEILAEPLPLIINVLTQYKTVEAVYEHLPDVEVI
jgi:hypothetical protein